MTDHEKKGDFDQWQREDEGGNKKAAWARGEQPDQRQAEHRPRRAQV